MKNYKQILEAVNRGIKLALDDFEDGDIQIQKIGGLDNRNLTKDSFWIYENFVDLGLPSGTLWAKYNLGCDWDKLNNDPKHIKPEDLYGNYYAWGELNRKKKYTLNNYKFYSYFEYTKYKVKAIFEDGLHELLLEDDVAYQTDKRFKIPTKEQYDELLKYTKKDNDDTVNGINGKIFTSTINNNTLFIPAAGFYNGTKLKDTNSMGCLWSSTINEFDYTQAWHLRITYANNFTDYDKRSMGFNIRPVLNIN